MLGRAAKQLNKAHIWDKIAAETTKNMPVIGSAVVRGQPRALTCRPPDPASDGHDLGLRPGRRERRPGAGPPAPYRDGEAQIEAPYAR